MLILEEQTGLNAGLNRGFKIGKLIKKNVRLRNVSVKNAVKVGKAVTPLAKTAISFLPAGKAVGIVSKIAKNGKLIKIANKVKKLGATKVGKFATGFVKPSVKNPISRIGNPDAEATDPAPMPNATPTPAQMDTIAEIKGVPAESLSTGTGEGEAVPNDAQIETLSGMKNIPSQSLKDEASVQRENAKTDPSSTGEKPNYTIPLVIGAVAVGGILLATKKSNNQ